jgi:hypothetical protein
MDDNKFIMGYFIDKDTSKIMQDYFKGRQFSARDELNSDLEYNCEPFLDNILETIQGTYLNGLDNNFELFEKVSDALSKFPEHEEDIAVLGNCILNPISVGEIEDTGDSTVRVFLDLTFDKERLFNLLGIADIIKEAEKDRASKTHDERER